MGREDEGEMEKQRGVEVFIVQESGKPAQLRRHARAWLALALRLHIRVNTSIAITLLPKVTFDNSS